MRRCFKLKVPSNNVKMQRTAQPYNRQILQQSYWTRQSRRTGQVRHWGIRVHKKHSSAFFSKSKHCNIVMHGVLCNAQCCSRGTGRKACPVTPWGVRMQHQPFSQIEIETSNVIRRAVHTASVHGCVKPQV